MLSLFAWAYLGTPKYFIIGFSSQCPIGPIKIAIGLQSAAGLCIDTFWAKPIPWTLETAPAHTCLNQRSYKSSALCLCKPQKYSGVLPLGPSNIVREVKWTDILGWRERKCLTTRRLVGLAESLTLHLYPSRKSHSSFVILSVVKVQPLAASLTCVTIMTCGLEILRK